MRYNILPKPDINVPQDDQHDLENALRRESAAHKILLVRGAVDCLDEAGQLYANMDHLLDHWPSGSPRDIWARQAIDLNSNVIPIKPDNLAA